MHSMVPVAFFERKYQICSTGRVWNKEKERWCTLSENPNGYWKVVLQLNGKEQHLIHQLVARHFLPNPYNHIQVNHRDGDKSHNSVGNLEWVSSSENIQHSLEAGLRQGFMSKEEKASYVLRILSGELIRNIAAEIGRGEESLSGMLRRHAYKNGQKEQWDAAMKERRRDVAIRNLPTQHTRNP